MQIIHTVAELRETLIKEDRVAFVPTMGNLHEGHTSLVNQARHAGGPVVASIFVNPLQFGLGEDFERYPRTLMADAEKLASAGCDLLFVPDVAEMYPEPQTFLVEPPLSTALCGAFRPGHFAGVCTVVLKLFEMVRPRYAVFGKKDYQQLFLIKAMARQFNLPIHILEGETLRAADGLALSSRNGYLSDQERSEAPRLIGVLRHIAESIASGHRDFPALESDGRRVLSEAGWRVDYISVRAQPTLLPPTPGEDRLVILGAAWINKTRLIDNLELTLD
jgi:pantoate--beta-alanine ligase